MTENYSAVLHGHDAAIRQITDAFGSGRMPHAWMIAGVEGIGKMTLAYHMAHYILSNGQNRIGNLDHTQPVARLVAAGTHPDMLVIGRAQDEKTGELRSAIIIEDALKVAAFLRKTATHGGWRVIVIDEAHRLNRFGQNAILKIIEEPPPRTVIILTVTTPGALLPTIRSRCRLLSLAPLDNPTMRHLLTRAKPELSPDEVDQLIRLSAGSIGFALKLIHTESLPLYEEMLEIITASGAPDIQRIHRLADQISRKADAQSFEALTGLLLDYLRHQARAAAVAANGAGAERALQGLDKITQLFASAETANLDRKLAFVNAISVLRAA